jgi:WS/DGAT/MGAT family acyltransferase
MPRIDAAWLHMDRSTNLMVINSLWLFSEPVDEFRLVEIIEARLLRHYPRFRQCAVEGRLGLGAAHWQDDPKFDLQRHVHRRGLAAPGDEAALRALVGDLMAAPLDRAKPLWDVYLIDGPGAGCALLIRMHHCIADGISLARVMLSLTDGTPGGDELPVDGAGAGGVVAATSAVALALAHEGLETILHPRHLVELAGGAQRELAAAARLIFMSRDADTSLRGELGSTRKVAWTPPFALAQIKQIANAQGATVNDVLLAAVSGALRSYLLRRDEEAPRLRAIVPFNLRPADRPIPRELGNHFGLVFLELPVDIGDRRRRLRAVKAGMDKIKRSPDGPLTFAVMAAIGATPAAVESRAIDVFSAKGTAVITNVPGPRQPIHLAGVHVRAVLVWAPASGDVGMSVSILSYQGEVTIGLMVDAHVMADPEVIVGHLEREVAALARLKPSVS